MSREHWKEFLPLIQAFIDGKTVQGLALGSNTIWLDLNNPEFNGNIEKYRIKPEPKWVPFTYNDSILFLGKWIKAKHGKAHNAYLITNCSDVGVLAAGMDIRWNGLLVDYVFIDNTPCGKLVGE